MKTLRILMAAVAALWSLGCAAQPSAFRSALHPGALLPSGEVSAFAFGGRLYCHSHGALLVAVEEEGRVVRFDPDTVLVRTDEGLDYMVARPASGEVYFTARDKKGRSALYAIAPEQGRAAKPRRVDMDDFEVVHPTFADDGNLMVFASTGRGGGGADYDLWYSTWSASGWSTPRNMGGRINTTLDETAPVVSQGSLFFLSSGRAADSGATALYVTPLITSLGESDTVGMLQIGRGRVLRMPEPFNQAGRSTVAVASLPRRGLTYWLTAEGSAPLALRSCEGPLDARFQWGYVRNETGLPLGGVSVAACRDTAVVCTQTTDELGFYGLYLPYADEWRLVFRHEDRFADTLVVPSMQRAGDYLLTEQQRDLTLGALPIGSPIHFDNLFAPGVGLPLSELGRQRLDPLVRFLRDNPHLSARLTLRNDLTADADFNRLLSSHRLDVLRRYLAGLLPPTVRLQFAVGGRVDPGTAPDGLSRLTVLLFKD